MAHKPDHPPEEQEHHKKAFELYYSLGDRRSYKQLADKLGVSPSTIKLWSGMFHWRQRTRERDADVARRLADQTQQSHADERGRNRKIVHLALMRLAKGIADGKVRMQLGDLDRLIRLQSFLDDPPPKPGELKSPEDIAEFMMSIFHPLDSDARHKVIRIIEDYSRSEGPDGKPLPGASQP